MVGKVYGINIWLSPMMSQECLALHTLHLPRTLPGTQNTELGGGLGVMQL